MVNKAIIIGNLGGDVEMRHTQDGTPVASFSVATTEKYDGKEFTEWHKVVAWKKLAEICNEYLIKGSRVYVEGKLKTYSWERDGNKHYKTEIIAREMKMLGGGEGKAQYDEHGRPPHVSESEELPF